MFRNTRRITTGTSYRAHLAVAAKLFLLPPSVPGAVVEYGCWKGGSTANLSLICDVVGRDLIVYDYCALFFSERWWARYFDRPPPGMMGVGTGIGVGQYYLGPMKGRSWVQSPTSAAYTRENFHGMCDFDPDDPDEVEKARGS